MKDLAKTPNDEFIYNIPRSKTDQAGVVYPVPVKGSVAEALIDGYGCLVLLKDQYFAVFLKAADIEELNARSRYLHES